MSGSRNALCLCPLMRVGAVLFAAVVATAAVCAQGSARPSSPSGEMTPQPATIRFEDLAVKAGIKFTLNNAVSAHRYSMETMAGGVAMFDYDNDGLLDLFFTNGAEIPSLNKSGPQYWNRLFHNNGNGTFTDVTERAGVQGIGYSMGVAAGDYDHDGFVDLYITGVNANQLLHNNGNGTFTDVTAKSGTLGMVGNKKGWAVAAGWIDYDNDGKLDLLVVNYLDYDVATAASCKVQNIVSYCSPDDFDGSPNILYRNNGDGTFTDVSVSSHIAQFVGKGMGLAFADYDGDGRTDVFISNDSFPNFLLHNNGDGTFSEQALDAGVAYKVTGKTVAGMGADFRDLDNDGRADIIHTAMFGDSFPIYRNLGGGNFEEVTGPSGVAASTSHLTGWSIGAYDLDNDGYKDLFATNGAILDNSEEVEHRPYALPNLVLRNQHGLTFHDVSDSAGPALNKPLPHRGAAFGDLNNDGSIDAVTTALGFAPQVLLNRTYSSTAASSRSHWLLLRLVGVQDNMDGLGTRVKITTKQGVQFNEATTAVGYNSTSDKRVHFGLGSASTVDRIDLWWPTGIHQILRDIKADQILVITESATSSK
jgi:enediyne biosynthesis protein E4